MIEEKMNLSYNQIIELIENRGEVYNSFERRSMMEKGFIYSSSDCSNDDDTAGYGTRGCWTNGRDCGTDRRD